MLKLDFINQISAKGRFLRDRSGQFAVMTALGAIPLCLGIAMAIDFSRMVEARTDIQQAADAATLSAVSNASKNFSNGGTFDQAWTEASAKKEAIDLFKANFPAAQGYTFSDVTFDVNRIGVALTATMSAKVTVPMFFMGLTGMESSAIQVNSVASNTVSPYTDVYVLADNSPSMAIGATPTDIQALERVIGCAFACHNLSTPVDTFKIAVDAKIPLRIDATREALAGLISTIGETTSQNEQYRIAGYHFGTSGANRTVTNFIPQTTNLDQAAINSLGLTLMGIPSSGYNNQMLTDLKLMMSQMQTIIGKAGTGESKTARQKLLMVITDGVNTTLRPTDCPIPMNGYGQCQSPIDPKWCDGLKENGVKIAVLYTTYYPVNSDGWYRSYIKPISANLPVKLAACASPDMFAEVQPHQGIKEALQALFKKTKTNPRLTN